MHHLRIMNPSGDPPGVLSRQRIVALIGAILVNIGSGTNYGFSGWGPQLGAKLHLSHTQLNFLALAGNLGVSSTGPVWGRISDLRGPVIPFTAASVLLLLGYSGIRIFFDAGLPDNATSLTSSSFLILILCGFMTGAGGSGGATGAMNAIVKSFPDRMRATAAGIISSGYGLSALFFSEIARVAFGGEPSPYLNLLAWGTAVLMLVGLLIVRPISLPKSPRHHTHEEEARGREGYIPLDTLSEDGAPPSNTQKKRKVPDIYGKALWSSVDFWVLFTTQAIFSGIGLMYINNVGSMVQALTANGKRIYDPAKSAKWQATQVSAISATNFIGRIISGLLSDVAKKNKFPRSFCLLLLSITLITTLVTVTHVDNIEQLWKASALLGLGYGGTFPLVASLAMDYFGLNHFSENWSYLCLSPLVGGNIFSLIFGRNLDAHEPSALASTGVSHVTCTAGNACYVEAIYLIMGAWAIGSALSIWICRRDWRRRDQLELED